MFAVPVLITWMKMEADLNSTEVAIERRSRNSSQLSVLLPLLDAIAAIVGTEVETTSEDPASYLDQLSSFDCSAMKLISNFRCSRTHYRLSCS